ncbi:hypothetical protein E8E11_001405 [Didymella keratinophila]|nr:hypothetical protein E8E11_001405 [Didymella keratinophila]
MTPRPTGLIIPSSPSFDSEAASQQLLAEASSPVRRHTTALPASSIAAQRSANLLNAARALPTSLLAPAPRAGKLAKSGQLKPSKVAKGKLPRASLAGLVSESSQKKARGKQLYDLEPIPQKQRASLPSQVAALDDEDDDVIPETSQVQPDDDAPVEIPESLDVSAPTEAFGDDDVVDAPTSPIMPGEDLVSSAAKQRRGRPEKSSESIASAATEVRETEEFALLAPFEPEKEVPSTSRKRPGRPRKTGESVTYLADEEESIVDAGPPTIATSEGSPAEEPKKGRGRPRKSGESVASVAAEEEPTAEAQSPTSTAESPGDEEAEAPKKRLGRPRKSGNSVVSRTSEVAAAEVHEGAAEETSTAPKKRSGRPRKSGESTTSRPSDVAFREVDESFRDSVLQGMQHQRLAAAMKAKRKGRPERDIETTTIGETDAGPMPTKKVKKLKGPKMISPDEPEFEEDVIPPISTPRQDVPQAARKSSRQESREIRRQERREAAQPHGDPQPEVEIPTRSTRTGSSRSQGDPATAPESSSVSAIVRKGTAAQCIAATTRAAMAASAPEPAKRKKPNRQIHISFPDSSPAAQAAQADEGDDEEAAQTSTAVTSNGRKARSWEEVGDAANAANGGQDQADNDEGNDVQDEQTQEEEHGESDDANVQDDDQNSHQRSQLPALDQVLDFADGEEWSGVCSVGLARKIHRTCDRVRVTLSKEDCSYDDIAECRDVLVQRLASLGSNIPADVRFDFKRDAYAYLFRALTLVFEAMYDKFQQEQGEEGEAMASLEALQILYPFIHEMLRFKNTMDSWKVRVTGQGHGDRLIKGVESELIAPLRIVEKDFKKRLSGLRKAEQDRKARIEMQQQRERQKQEMSKQEEALRSSRERRKRWQDLHIVRMQCESDPYRRRRLRFVEPPASTETDANGNEFERVPFFGERSAPPPSSVITSSGKDWTPEQDTALLDALQSFTPLEDIFRKHCRPRGPMREFTVSDFAAKLAWDKPPYKPRAARPDMHVANIVTDAEVAPTDVTIESASDSAAAESEPVDPVPFALAAGLTPPETTPTTPEAASPVAVPTASADKPASHAETLLAIFTSTPTTFTPKMSWADEEEEEEEELQQTANAETTTKAAAEAEVKAAQEEAQANAAAETEAQAQADEEIKKTADGWVKVKMSKKRSQHKKKVAVTEAGSPEIEPTKPAEPVQEEKAQLPVPIIEAIDEPKTAAEDTVSAQEGKLVVPAASEDIEPPHAQQEPEATPSVAIDKAALTTQPQFFLETIPEAYLEESAEDAIAPAVATAPSDETGSAETAAELKPCQPINVADYLDYQPDTDDKEDVEDAVSEAIEDTEDLLVAPEPATATSFTQHIDAEETVSDENVVDQTGTPASGTNNAHEPVVARQEKETSRAQRNAAKKRAAAAATAAIPATVAEENEPTNVALPVAKASSSKPIRAGRPNRTEKRTAVFGAISEKVTSWVKKADRQGKTPVKTHDMPQPQSVDQLGEIYHTMIAQTGADATIKNRKRYMRQEAYRRAEEIRLRRQPGQSAAMKARIADLDEQPVVFGDIETEPKADAEPKSVKWITIALAFCCLFVLGMAWLDKVLSRGVTKSKKTKSWYSDFSTV